MDLWPLLAIQILLLAIIAWMLSGILAAVKAGFNEVVKGLEAIESRINRS